MNNPITLSLITAVYNAENTIQETIESIINQSIFSTTTLEHIIIDGESTDNTLNILKKLAKKYPHIRYKSESDKGIYDAFNKGIKCAKGEYIGIINADDYYCERTFEYVINAFKHNTEVDIVHGDLLIEYENKISISKPNLNKYAHYFVMPFNHPTCFLKASVYSDVGLFDSSYKIAGDHEFILRTLKKGKTPFYLAKTLAFHRYNGASTENLVHKERVSIRTKHGMPQLLSHFIVWSIDAKRLFKKKLLSLGLR